MRIAVLSGKGGTGKTLVSVNLAAVAQTATYVDCDVEEPNGYLFFKPENLQKQPVAVKIPKWNAELCNGCRECVEFCKFNALAYIKDKLFIFDEVCHSCGGCSLLCPQKALTEEDKVIGNIEKGTSDGVRVHTGILNIGEVSGIPIIQQLLLNNSDQKEGWTLIDCPPGSACSVMESIQGADYCVLVAEPTLFGVHNLQMVYELVQLLDVPFGVVINKSMDSENPAETFCRDKNIKILSRIPFDHTLAELNSNGEIAVRTNETYRAMFTDLLKTIQKEVHCETIAHSER